MGDVYMVNGKILSGLPNHAKDIEFDNTGTDLISTNSEDAIKEVNSNLTWTLLKSYTAINQSETVPITAKELKFVVKSTDSISAEQIYTISDISGLYMITGIYYKNTGNNMTYELVPIFTLSSSILELKAIYAELQTLSSVDVYYR